jgi:hypothetical protein
MSKTNLKSIQVPATQQTSTKVENVSKTPADYVPPALATLGNLELVQGWTGFYFDSPASWNRYR